MAFCSSASGLAAAALQLLAFFQRGVFDKLFPVILSLGKSALAYGKMALTCLYAGSDGWLPVSVSALTAQGLCFLVLSEAHS